MKLTKARLKQIIKEELSASIQEENRVQNAIIDYIAARKAVGMEDHETLKTEVMEMFETAYAHRYTDKFGE